MYLIEVVVFESVGELAKLVLAALLTKQGDGADARLHRLHLGRNRC